MSARNGRRHRKKADDDPDFRPSPRKEEPIKVKPVEPEPVVIVTEENGQIETKKPEVVISVEEEVVVIDTKEAEKVKETNGNNGVQAEPATIIEEAASADVADAELEPLVVDTEDPELQFDDNSDIDSYKDAPTSANRCSTRRSLTRNIPTPKTPRSANELNGDDKEHIANGNGEEKVPATPDIDVASEKQIETATLVFDTNMETPPPTEENLTIPDGDLNASVQSCESAFSTQVNVGSDVTREIELTLPDENSFINTAKDLSVIETLRRMSSRRAIRSTGSNSDYRKTLLKSQAERHDMYMQQQRASIEKVTGTKRKTRSKTPENTKRLKTESSPGFFSYISSPISMLKNRFSGGDSISASTPKLTSYREQEIMEDPELSKIEDSKAPAEKKRCIIM